MSSNPGFFEAIDPNSVMTTNLSNFSEPPELLPELLPPPPKVVRTVRSYTRTVHARLVSFRCEWCSQERQVWQYPGAAPRYCEECRGEAQQAMNSARQREKRERERQANPYTYRRPVGRPRKNW